MRQSAVSGYAVMRASASRLLLALLLAIAANLALAQQPVGEILYAFGLTSVQNPDAPTRFVQKGAPLRLGDVVGTSDGGFAVLQFIDGTKITVRPNSTFAVDKFSHGAGEESAFFRLLKGGVRTFTGLVSKRNPQGMRMSTGTATLGIRGASFDARICDNDCAEPALTAKPPVPAAPTAPVVARIAVVAGGVTVLDAKGEARIATVGTPLLAGESVRTDRGAFAVIAFRDESKVTVSADSELKLETVRFGGAASDAGEFVLNVVRGGLRAVTGALARRAPDNVKVRLQTTVLGIRGTGFDAQIALDCVAPGQCAPAVFVHTWRGAISLTTPDGVLQVDLDRSGVYNPLRKRPDLLERTPQFILDNPVPRPDTVPVDFENLFAVTNVTGTPPGVFVWVRDGHVIMTGPDGMIDLGPGESGYLGRDARKPVRLIDTPPLLRNDPYPLPEFFDERTITLIDVLNPGGKPGDLICEVQ